MTKRVFSKLFSVVIRLRLVTWVWLQLWARTIVPTRFLAHQNSWLRSYMMKTTQSWWTFTHLACVCWKWWQWRFLTVNVTMLQRSTRRYVLELDLQPWTRWKIQRWRPSLRSALLSQELDLLQLTFSKTPSLMRLLMMTTKLVLLLTSKTVLSPYIGIRCWFDVMVP